MAVDIRQLRIGSHVSIDGKKAKIVGIRTASSMSGLPIVQYTTAGVVRFGELPSDSALIEPIAITPALLEELGFEYKSNDYWTIWQYGGFEVVKREESQYWTYSGSIINLEYLHELENLFYIIYGNELIPD